MFEANAEFERSSLLLGDSDSLSVSYGMEPEQEALSIVSFKTERPFLQLIN